MCPGWLRGRHRRAQRLSGFDKGANPLFIPQIIDVLAQNQVPATFLVIGAYAADWSELIRLL
ncbi:hypothetical protein EH240_31795 [Mesorhizobium tamadayense]|uniref:Chitooligosaccharide deacetylase n=1 Tax=Mesorhizobium tamadayense TaxID=425306 RepID=A0A3P3EZV9_9HYPH|nr:hypothetical protein EH240_31795 [Mesorhizobium tamadayense]